MILVIDNYDSFTFNLVQLIGGFTNDVAVKRNDAVSVEDIRSMKPSGIVISPGPGRPEHAGVTVEAIRRCGSAIPILGVCLGHQAIGQAFGASIVHAPSLMHGRASRIRHDGSRLFDGVANPFEAGRYHSLVVSKEGFPSELLVSAESDDGTIMGIRHRTFPIDGVQFHPESVLTAEGVRILANWLEGRVGYESLH